MLLAALSVPADVVLVSFFNKTRNKRKQKAFDEVCKLSPDYQCYFVKLYFLLLFIEHLFYASEL